MEHILFIFDVENSAYKRFGAGLHINSDVGVKPFGSDLEWLLADFKQWLDKIPLEIYHLTAEH